jgi:type I restriction enzyme S subunit
MVAMSKGAAGKAGWVTKRLSDFSRAISTGPFGSLLHKSDYVDDGVPLVNPINMANDRILPDPAMLISETTRQRLSNYVLVEGDVVVGRRGEIGRCAVVSPTEAGWLCGTGSFFIRPLPSMDSQFLAYLIRSSIYRRRLEEAATGTTMKNLSNTALSDLVVSIPRLPEQQRIVGILDEAFDGIATAKANAEKNLQNARALFESHLQAVFTEAWRSCRLVPLSELATDVTDGDHVPPPKSVIGVPFITIGNIQKDTRTIDFTNTFMVPNEYFNRLKANRRPQRGDVLYTVTGSFGIPVIVKDDMKFCFQRHIALVRPKAETQSGWLYYLLLSPQVFSQADTGATGTAQRTVSLALLRSIQVPRVPPPQQRSAVTTLDAVATQTQRLESIYRQKLDALDALKKSLLDQAFTGRL